MSKKAEQFYKSAREQYADYGVDTESALKTLGEIALSIHAWQGDDVVGFEKASGAMSGGCQVTGNYPGRARTADELRADLDKALSLIPGTHRVNLQGHQVDKSIKGIDRNEYGPEHFSRWLAWARNKGVKLDIAPAFYSHPKLDHGLSLSHPDPKIRKFWIGHGQAIRRIAAGFGRELGSAAVCNFWMPDGSKDIPVDRFTPRMRMQESLDACFAERFPEAHLLDAVEGKLFGIGVESYTVGSHEFFMGYAVSRKKLLCVDSGHFHPTEHVGDKLSAVLCNLKEILLHVSRGVRWDSDHVLVLNDELLAIAQETVRYGYLNRIHIGLDYFDASINRIAAWVIGSRNMQKALLSALLEPKAELLKRDAAWDGAGRLALMEEAKTLPLGAVWNYFCEKNSVPEGLAFMDDIRSYESRVLSKRR